MEFVQHKLVLQIHVFDLSMTGTCESLWTWCVGNYLISWTLMLRQKHIMNWLLTVWKWLLNFCISNWKECFVFSSLTSLMILFMGPLLDSSILWVLNWRGSHVDINKSSKLNMDGKHKNLTIIKTKQNLKVNVSKRSKGRVWSESMVRFAFLLKIEEVLLIFTWVLPQLCVEGDPLLSTLSMSKCHLDFQASKR